MKHLFTLLVLLLPATLFAQTFDKAIGIRGGLSSGIEYRFYTDDANSYKFLLATRDNGVQLHAFKEFHQFDMFNFTDQLIFFYGVGVHFGYEQWDKYFVHDNTSWYEDRTALLAGLDGLAGVEYLFYEVPLSIGLEVKPYFDVLGREMFNIELFDFAFTLKYHF
ncbi:hypothetical protein OU798_08205 [Prolixibacteraceae bacterium Z1-6]|uniref:DUF3575 domain-containing protein n=1 Tax=Draconibacterium aestuarii TaxID=2998507 RepID=A0A9X3F5U6_9BACT|nr:hypothetical protein [Prolixibacteraceae bacterium Z1-6]